MSLLHAGYQELVERYVEIHADRADAVATCAVRLQAACADVRQLIGKCVLDLGCGSKKGKDNTPHWARLVFPLHPPREFVPRYLRLAAFAGMDATGIDIAPNDGEPFTAITADLTDPRVLAALPSGRFHIISNNMFTAPSGSKDDRPVTSPFLFEKLGSPAEVYTFNNFLREHVLRLLVDGGAYTHMQWIFRKHDDQLHRIGLIEQVQLPLDPPVA